MKKKSLLFTLLMLIMMIFIGGQSEVLAATCKLCGNTKATTSITNRTTTTHTIQMNCSLCGGYSTESNHYYGNSTNCQYCGLAGGGGDTGSGLTATGKSADIITNNPVITGEVYGVTGEQSVVWFLRKETDFTALLQNQASTSHSGTTYTITLDLSSYGEGNYLLGAVVRGADGYLDTTETLGWISVCYDKTAPTSGTFLEKTTRYSKNVSDTFTFSAQGSTDNLSGVEGMYLYISSNGGQSWNIMNCQKMVEYDNNGTRAWYWDVVFSSAGSYMAQVCVMDNAGNWNFNGPYEYAIIDTEMPTATGITLSAKYTKTGKITATATGVTDTGGSGIKSVQWYLIAPDESRPWSDQASDTQWTKNIDVSSLAEGKYQVGIVLQDNAGNSNDTTWAGSGSTSVIGWATFRYDKTAPSVSISATNNANSVTLKGSITDNIGITDYAWTNSSSTPTSWTSITSTTSSSPSKDVTSANIWYLHTKDATGNTSSANKTTYSVTYDANDGSGAPATQYKANGVALTLSSTKPTRAGYTFTGWNTVAGGTGTAYSAGGSYTANANVTLYAQWRKNTFDVTLGSTSYTYTGNEIKPTVTVKDANTSATLTSGTHYTVSYSNNKNVGTATITVTGKGDYQLCTKTPTFTITAKGLSTSGISAALSKTSFEYTGSAIKPTAVVTYGSITLASGADYTISYSNNINVGTSTATATITGKGNYTGTKALKFSIVDTTKPTKPTFEIKYQADDTTHTNGNWANRAVYTTMYSEDIAGVTSFQYTTNPSGTWNTFGLEYGGGLKNTGNKYYGSESWYFDNRMGTYYFRAVDANGNISDVSDPYYLKYDKTAPTASISATNNANSVTLTGTLTDSYGVINAYAWTNSASTPSSWTTITETTSSTQTKSITSANNWYLHVKDAAGNTSSTNITTYSVAYDANGGSNAPATQYKAQGVALTLTNDASKPTLANNTFAGWKATDGASYSKGASYTADASTTMTAQWVVNQAGLTINPNGGSWNGVTSSSSITQNSGTTLKIPNPIRSGYKFNGWTLSGSGTLNEVNLSGFGYKTPSQATIALNSNNDMVVTASDVDSKVYLPTNFNTNTIKKVRVTMDNATTSTYSQIFFSISGSSYVAANVATAYMSANASDQVLVHDFSSVSGWSGSVTELRFDFGSVAGTYTIKKIEFLDANNDVYMIIDDFSEKGYTYTYANAAGVLTANWTAANYSVGDDYYATLADAYSAIKATGKTGTITVYRNNTDTSAVTIDSGYSITIDTNGKTVTKTNYNGIINIGTLSIIGNGTIQTSPASTSDTYQLIYNKGALNITDATLKHYGYASTSGIILFLETGTTTVNINSGKLIGALTENISSPKVALIHPKSGTTNIKGGTFQLDSGVDGIMIDGFGAGAVNITGGTFINEGPGNIIETGSSGSQTINISNGSFSSSAKAIVLGGSNKTLNITGGTIESTGSEVTVYTRSSFTGTLSITGGTIKNTGTGNVINHEGGTLTIGNSSDAVSTIVPVLQAKSGTVVNSTGSFGFYDGILRTTGTTYAGTITVPQNYTLNTVSETLSGTTYKTSTLTATGISTHPSSVTVNEGASPTFTVGVNGDASTYTYQWYYVNSNTNTGGTAITASPGGATASGYNSATLTLANINYSWNNWYVYCVATPALNASPASTAVTSNAAKITVYYGPRSITSPSSVTVNEGDDPTFTATASGGNPDSYTYQWYWTGSNSNANGTAMTASPGGATATGYNTATLTLKDINYSWNNYYVFVEATNGKGSIRSTPAKITVYYGPRSITSPSAVTVNEGASPTFTATASNGNPASYTYKWYYSSTNSNSGGTVITTSTTGADCTGVTTATLTLSNIQMSWNNYYVFAEASNGKGTIRSTPALITVKDATAPTKPTFEIRFQSDDSVHANNTYTNKILYTKLISTDDIGVTEFQYTQTPNDENSWKKLNLKYSNGISKNGTTYTGSESWGLYDRTGTYYFRAVDAANNKSEASDPYYLKYDVTAPTKPTFVIKYQSDNAEHTNDTWTNKALYTTITTTEAVGLNQIQWSTTPSVENSWAKLNFGSAGLQQSGTTYSGSENWSFRNRYQTIYFRAIDTVGNISSLSDAYILKYDATKPVATITATNNANSVTLKGVIKDEDGTDYTASGVVGYAWTNSSSTPTSWTSTNWTAASPVKTMTLSNKSVTSANTWYLHTKDAAGNVNSTNIATYSIAYNANGGSNAPATQYKAQGVALTLTNDASKPTLANNTFAGWKATDGTSYSKGASYTADASTTMTAQWVVNQAGLTINPNGGSWKGVTSSSSITQNSGTTLEIPDPVRAGYKFNGWTLSGGGTLNEVNMLGYRNPYDATISVNSNNDMVVTATGGDPQVRLSTNVSTSVVKKIRVTLAGVPKAGTFQIFFSTGGNLSENNSSRASYAAGSDDQVIIIDFSEISGWTGNLTYLRFDPGSATGDYTIKKIEFLDASNNVYLIHDNFNEKGYTYTYADAAGVLTANWTAANYSVGDDYYATIAEAYTAIKGTSGTIKVENSNTDTSSLTIASGKTITLDTNGKTVTLSRTNYGYGITNEGTLAIEGNGTITAKNTNIAVLIYNKGTLNIRNVTLLIEGTFDNSTYGVVIEQEANTTLNITDSTLNAKNNSTQAGGARTIRTAGGENNISNSTIIVEGNQEVIAIEFNNATSGKLTISSGTVVNTKAQSDVYTVGVCISDTSSKPEVIIEDNTQITATTAGRAVRAYCGTVKILGGTLTGGYGAYTSGTASLTIGALGSGVDITKPVIIGTSEYGVRADSGFDFYDGILKGKTNGYTGTVNNKEDGYGVATGSETINSVAYKTAYLAPQPTAPTITVKNADGNAVASGAWSNTNLTITISGSTISSGSVGYQYRINNGSWTNYSSAFTYSTEIANAKLEARAYNTSATSVVSSSTSYTINLDKTAPVITGTTKTPSDYTTGNVSFKFNATDNISGVSSYSASVWNYANCTKFTTITASTSVSNQTFATYGYNAEKVYLIIKDKAGNEARTTITGVNNIDRTAPIFINGTTHTAQEYYNNATKGTMLDATSDFSSAPSSYKTGTLAVTSVNDGTVNSSKVLKITHASGSKTSGWQKPYYYETSKVYVRKIYAKIPTGYSLILTGNRVTQEQTNITTFAGTGEWQEYSCVYMVSDDAVNTMTYGHAYISGAAATSAFDWYVATDVTYDVTNVFDDVTTTYSGVNATMTITAKDTQSGTSSITVNGVEQVLTTSGTSKVATYDVTTAGTYEIIATDGVGNATTLTKTAYIITYNGNGSTGGSTATQIKINGAARPVSTNGFTKTGYSFTGWNTAANGSGTAYAAGANYAGDANVTLYAQWKQNTFTVADIASVTYNGSAQTPTLTVKDGNTTLTSGTHYTATYTNNTNAGTATVKVTGIGNYATYEVTKTFTINKAVPTLTMDSICEMNRGSGYTRSARYNGDGQVTIVSADETIAEIDIQGSVFVIYGRSAGTTTITASASEGENYLAAESKTMTVIVYGSPTRPTITVKDTSGKEISSNSWATSNLTITLSGSTLTGPGDIQYQYSYDNSSWIDYTSPITYNTNTTEQTIYARAYNTSSLEPKRESDVRSFNIKLDTGKPGNELTLDNGINGAWTNKEVTAKVTGTDNVSGVSKIEYSTNNSTWTELDTTTASPNLIKNSDLSETTTVNPGWDTTKNGNIQAIDWSTGYNGGVDLPAEGYHAHINSTDFDFNTIRFVNQNSDIGYLGRWLGITYTTTGVIKAGTTYTLSYDIYGDTAGMISDVGPRYSLTDGTAEGFHNSRNVYTISADNVNKWTRVTYTFTTDELLNEANRVVLYFYGHNKVEGTTWLKNIQLEEGSTATEYRPNAADQTLAKKEGTVKFDETYSGTIYSRTTDVAGNVSAVSSEAINIDMTMPKVEVSNITYPAAASIKLTDAHSGIKYFAVTKANTAPTTAGTTDVTTGNTLNTWYQVANTTSAKTVSFTGLSAGTYYAWGKDLAGNYTSTQFTVSKANPTLTLEPENDDVAFNASNSFTATANVAGKITVTSGAANVSITAGNGASLTANKATTVSYKGATATTSATTITVVFTPTDTTNYNSVTKEYKVDSVNKIANTLKVTAVTGLKYNGSAKALVTASGAQGDVWYAIGTQLTSSNYSTAGNKTIPTGTNATTYKVYYYTPGNTNYLAASGSVEVTIANADITGSASISGTLTYGSVLTASASTTPSDATKTYQWYINTTKSNTGGTPISGATSSSLSLVANQFGKYVYVVVKANKANYNEATFTSSVTETVIGQRPITVTSGTSSKIYDGKALTNSTFTVSETLPYDHRVEITNTTSITNVGSVANNISNVIVYSTSNNNVTEYYKVTKAAGTLTVTKATISNTTATIDAIADQTYTGSAITPLPVVKFGDTTLTKDTDYTLSYSSNTNVGTATVTATGKGNYDGSISKTFKIVNANMTGITVKGHTGVYDGASHGITVLLSDTSAGATVKYGTASGTYTLTESPTYKDVNTYTVYYQITKANYNTVTGSTQVKITAATPEITIKDKTATYDGSAVSVDAATVTGVAEGDKSAGAITYTYYTNSGCTTQTTAANSGATSNGGAPVNAGEYFAKATIAANGNYTSATSAAAKITISQRNASNFTVTLSPTSYNYDGTAKQPEVTVKDGTKQLSVGTDYTVTHDTSAEVGTRTVTITGKGNYTGTKTENFVINAIAPTITIKDKTVTYNGGVVAVDAATVTGATNGVAPAGTVTYTYYTDVDCTTKTSTTDNSGATSNGGAPKNAGTYYAKASIAANGNYTAATSAKVTIKINVKPLTLTWGETSFAYTGTAQKPTATVSSGVTGETVNIVITGEQSAVGEHTATASISSVTGTNNKASNYSLTNPTTKFYISNDNITLNATLGTTTYVYDGTAKQPSVTVTTVVNGVTKTLTANEYTVTYDTSATAKDVGTKTVTITGKGDYAGKGTTSTFTITPKTLTYTPNAGQSKVYGTANPTLTGSFSGNVDSSEPGKNGALTRATGEDVGTYNITQGTLTLADNGTFKAANYTLSFKTGVTFAITPKNIAELSLSLAQATYTYDGAAKQPGLTAITYAGKALVAGTDYTMTYDTSDTAKNVGTKTVTVVGKGNFNGSKELTFTIEEKSVSGLTVTLNPTSYVYDGSAKKPTVTVKDGTATLAEGTDYTVTHDSSAEVGTRTVTITGKGNYAETKDVTFTITKADNTLVVTGKTGLTYTPGNAQELVTVSNAQGDVYFAIGTELTSANYKDDGSQTIPTAMDAKSYTIYYYTPGNNNYKETKGSVTASIGMSGMTGINATGHNAKYDGLYHGITVTLSDTSEGATVKYGTVQGTYNLTSSPTYKNVGTYTVYYEVTKANYDTVIGSATVTITAKEIAVTWGETNLVYTGKSQAPIAGSANTIAGVNGETINLNISGAQTNVGTNYKATASIASVTTGEKTNYVLTDNEVTFSIALADDVNFNVSLNQNEFNYTGEAHEPTPTVKVNIDGEEKTLKEGTDYEVEYDNNTDATTEAIVKIIGKGNYAGKETTVKFTINPVELTVVWSNTILVFDGTAKAPIAANLTGVNGETVKLNVSGAQTAVGKGYTATASIASVEKSDSTAGNVNNYTLKGDTTTFDILMGNYSDGTNVYETLKDAFDNAISGSTITVLQDVEEDASNAIVALNKEFVLNTAGYTITKTTKYITIKGKLEITGAGTISASTISLLIQNDGTLDITGECTLSNTNSTIIEGNGSLNITAKANLIAKNNAINQLSTTGKTINISNGTIDGQISVSGVELNITGGSFTKSSGYIIAYSGTGTANISNAVIEGNSTYTVINSGTGTLNINSGEISSKAYTIRNANTGTINIKGGTISGQIPIDNASTGTIKITNDAIINATNYVIRNNSGKVIIGENDGNVSTQTPEIIAKANIYDETEATATLEFYDGILKASYTKNVIGDEVPQKPDGHGIKYGEETVNGTKYYTAVLAEYEAPEAPVVTATAASDAWSKQNVTVTITAGVTIPVGGQTLQYKINDGEWTEYTDVITVDTEGITTITARAINTENPSDASLMSEEVIYIVKVDTEVPEVTANNVVFGSNTNITLTDATSGIVGYIVSESSTTPIASSDWTEISKTTNVEIEYSPEKATTYYVWAIDEAGNISTRVQFIVSAKNITDADVDISITPIEYDYTGDAKQPAVVVKIGEKPLVKGTDYSVAYSNNTNVGSATDDSIANRPTVKITGIGNYGGTVNKYFTIKSVGLAVTVTGYDAKYDGLSHSITVNAPTGATVTYSTDGTTYSTQNPTFKGVTTTTVYVKVEKENYNTYTTEATVKITAKDVAVTWPVELTLDYTGAPIAPVAGTNNTISGVNGETINLSVSGAQTDIGGPYTAKATIASVTNGDVSNYELTNDEVQFYVSNSNVKFDATLSETSYIYDGQKHNPTVTVKSEKDGKEITLIAGTDYTVEYDTSDNAKNVGTKSVKITGLGNYAGLGTTLTYEITKKDIIVTPNANQNMTYGDEDITLKYTYSGNISGETPAFDGKLSREDGTDAKEYVITQGSLTLKDNGSFLASNYNLVFNGKDVNGDDITVEIIKRDISEMNITLDQATFTYDGTAKEPNAIIVLNSNNLVKDTDFTITYDKNIDAGTAKAIVTGKGNFTGTKEVTFTINKVELEVVWTNTSLEFNGKSQVPTAGNAGKITGVNGETINLVVIGAQTNVGSDYTAEIDLNSVTVSGGRENFENYKLTNTSTKFEIVLPADFAFDVTLDENAFNYDGQAHTPAPTVKVTLDGVETTLNTTDHYDVSYLYNKNVENGAQKPTVVITGKGNYTGVNSNINFAINRIDLTVTPDSNQSKVYGELDKELSYKYTGNIEGETPVFTGNLVRESGNNVGKYLIKVGTLGLKDNGAFIANNYNLVVVETVEYEILKADISNAKVTLTPDSYEYDGNPKTPETKVELSGNTLVKDTDYSVEYKNNTEDGVATVVITGKGNYTGTKEATFTIIDTSAPSAPIINAKTTSFEGEVYTSGTATSKNVFIELSTTDDDIVAYEWSLTPDGEFTSEGLVMIGDKARISYSDEMNQTIYFRSVDTSDNIGNVSSITVVIDKTAPEGTITIVPVYEKDGEKATNSNTVKINVDVTDNYSEDANIDIAFINEVDYDDELNEADITWQDYAPQLEWELTAGQGRRRVYVIIRDEAGNQSKQIAK